MKTHYERLSALDASFLEIEDTSTHMHVAATLLFEPGPLATPEGGLDMERIRAYIESRLVHIPRYRQRLEYVPYEQHPVWIDDERFNVFYHVRHTSLPRPGSERQLKRLVGRILSQKLDATKPLWEMWVIEGLEGGRFAIVAKAHHCMVDGVSGVDLITVILAPTPEDGFAPGDPWQARPAPSARELVAGELWRRAAMPLDLVRAAARVVTEPGKVLSTAIETAAGFVNVLGENSAPATETPINPERIGPHRRFDWLHMDLREVKAVKRRLGGTLNDVVLATVVGALRRFLPARGVAVDELDFRALVPVSIRASSEHGSLGNRVAQMITRLPVDEPDPYRCLQRVTTITTRLKRSHQVEASEWLEGFDDWAGLGIMTQVMRLSSERRMFNLVVTNVPGPPVPLYMLGAPLLAAYPGVPLFTNQALGIALFSYCDDLFWGVTADWEVVPDLHDFVLALEQSFADLVAAQ